MKAPIIDDNTEAQDLVELIEFFGHIGKAAAAGLIDDGKISFFEALGMLTYLREVQIALSGAATIPAELDKLTPHGAMRINTAIADIFPGILRPRQDAIARAALACVPNFVQLIQVIRNTNAEASDGGPAVLPR